MAKTKRPPVDIGDVTETLKESKGQGMDVFFSTPPNEDNDNSQTINDTGKTHTLTDKPDKEISAETKDLNKKVKKRNERRKEVRDDVTTSPLHDVGLRGWRDTIENTETHNSSLRLTMEESDEIEDLIKELKRKLKIKTSLNEVARLG